tara:strand:+ start:26 stop:1213 length:1188 start_codon:yes stop_codon:yes gene_type:complete
VIDILKPLIQQFMPFAQQKMGFSRPPKLFLRDDPQNAANPLGKTGFYDPQAESVTLYTTGRHPKDIMRSLAHELMHHTQKCNGDFDGVQNMGEEGYAQADPHMRTMEIQAYQASIVFRDWEDSTKGTIYYEHLQKGDKGSMSTKNWKNGELKSLLAESWGFKADLSKLNEEEDRGHKKDEYKRSEDEEGHESKTGEGSEGHYKDYEGPSGGNKDDKSKTDKGDKDYTWRKGEESKTHSGVNKEGLIREDSEEEEDEHEERNRDADQTHIDAIRDHLRALEKDKDYDEDHIDEGCPSSHKPKKGDDIDDKYHQGYKDKEDESLGMRTGKESGKKQSMKARRDDSYGKWGKRDKEKRHTSLEESATRQVARKLLESGYSMSEVKQILTATSKRIRRS